MRVFDCGPEWHVRERLAAFIEEMDERGVEFGTPGDGTANCEPCVLSEDHGVVDESEHQFVWLILSGTATVSGRDGKAVVGAGQGALWDAGESWEVEPGSDSLVYLDVDGPLLTVQHFALPGPA